MEFICDFCNLAFKGKGYLLRHIENKHLVFHCAACKSKFRQKRNLLNHLRNHFEKYICEYCSLQFNYDKLQEHIISNHEQHRKEYLYNCRFCERKFHNAVFRNSHENDVHKGREDSAFKCQECNIVFLKKDQLRIHNLESHHIGYIYFCPHTKCDRYFKSIKLLKIHEKIHGPAYFQCKSCGKNFKQSSNYSKHKKRCKGPISQKDYTEEELAKMSEIAQSQFIKLGGKTKINDNKQMDMNECRTKEIKHNEIDYLKEFEKEVKENLRIAKKNRDTQKSRISQIDKILICDKCAMEFDSSRSFRKHERGCTNQIPKKISCEIPKEIVKLNITTSKTFKCSESGCKMVFKNSGNLKKHISQVHLNERSFQCDKCAKFFKTKHHLQIHLKTHEQPKKCPICLIVLPNIEAHIKRHKKEKKDPLNCSQCNKKFATKQTLHEHVQRIHEKKPLGRFYTCSVCHENFIRNSDLRRHSFLHYQGKIFSCGYPGCSEMFKNSYKLKLHQVVHNEKANQKNYVCDICNKSYPRQSSLYKHKKMHLRKQSQHSS